jgi:hypothetical protein
MARLPFAGKQMLETCGKKRRQQQQQQQNFSHNYFSLSTVEANRTVFPSFPEFHEKSVLPSI